MRSLALLSAVVLFSAPESHAIEWSCSDAALPEEACGLATCNDVNLTTGDALLVLRSAVGNEHCSFCRCDADGSGRIGSRDALRILRGSVGLLADLLCPSCNDLQIVVTGDTAELDEVVDDVLANGEDGMYVVSRDGGSIAVRTFDHALEAYGIDQRIETGQSVLFGALACSGSDGKVGVAWDWTPETDFPVPHDYDDTGNVRLAVLPAGATSAEPIDAHTAVNGSQRALGILCRDGGGFSIVWSSSDSAYRETTEGSLSHYDAPGAPLNGIYFRNYDERGETAEDPALVFRTYDQPFWPWSRAAPSPTGHVLLGSRGHVFVVDESGDIDASANLVGDSYFGSAGVAACSDDSGRCVTVLQNYTVRAVVYEALAPGSPLYLHLRQSDKEYGEPYSLVTEPAFRTAACDELGICVATWTLTRRRDVSPEEPSEAESLGSFGRAFNLNTGDVGEEFPLPTPRIHNVGPGRFVSVERSAYGDPAHSVLHTFEVR